MDNIKIIASAYSAAKNVVTNDDLSKIVDTSDEWIYSRTGIKQRRYVADEGTTDLAVEAARKAIEANKIEVSRITHIIVATMSADHIMPSCACLVQERLGLNNQEIMAFDVNAACSGFVYALQIANSMLQEGKYALVIGAEVLSKLIDFTDRNTCVLFGDGAGAVLVEKHATYAKSYHYARSIGDNEGILVTPGIDKKTRTVGFLQMDGREVFRFAVSVMEESILKVCEKANLDVNDIDFIIPHQANVRIISRVSKKMDIPLEKFYTNVHEFGNTSAASVAIAYAQASEEGILQKGMKVILVGFGGGFTYGATLIEI